MHDPAGPIEQGLELTVTKSDAAIDAVLSRKTVTIALSISTFDIYDIIVWEVGLQDWFRKEPDGDLRV